MHLSRNAVPDVEFLQVVRIFQQHLFVSEVDRGWIGDPGLEIQDFPLFGCVLLDILGNLRPRADQAHLSLQDIPKLGQFIQFCLSEDSANPSNARISIAGYQWSG